MAKELSVLPIFNNINVGDNSLSVFLSKLFNGTLLAKYNETGTIIRDTVLKFDLRGELGVGIELGRQAIPIVANECIVRCFYFIRHLAIEIREHDIRSFVDLKQINWGRVNPSNNPTIARMLVIATGVFTTVDVGEAFVNQKYWVSINYVGVGRFAIAIGEDISWCLKARSIKKIKQVYKDVKRFVYTQADDIIYERIGTDMNIEKLGLTIDQTEIAYDCEYQSIGNGERVILSYQFALYLDDDSILEICFISRRFDKKNRLYLRTCIGAILDLLRKFFSKQYVNYGYSSTRRYCINAAMPLFEGSDERYFINRENMNESEMKTFVETVNPLIIADTGNIKRTNNFKDSYKYATSLTIVCHTGSVDLSAFKDDLFGFRKKRGSILPYLKSMQGGTTSIYPYKTNIPSASEYWKFYPVGILFRDTMCYAPADKKSLEALGESIEVPKIKLGREIKLNMQSYLLENPYDFLAYAAQDALVTLMYGSRLWGVNTEWCLTTTSGSAFIMKESIASYMNIPRDIHGNINKSLKLRI